MLRPLTSARGNESLIKQTDPLASCNAQNAGGDPQASRIPTLAAT